MEILLVVLIILILFLINKVHKISKNLSFFNENLLSLTKKLDDLTCKLDKSEYNSNLEDIDDVFAVEPVEFKPVENDQLFQEEILSNCNNLKVENPNIPKDLTTLVKQASWYIPEATSDNIEDNKTVDEQLSFDEKETQEVKTPNTLAIRTKELLNRIWQWFIVGDDYASKDIPREYAVAITWLLRCAVILIVFGIGYFVKYSHDNNFFPPQTRLLISGVVTMGLIAGGCYLFKTRYRIFGATLGGAGFIGLYLTIFAGVGLYKVITPLHGLIMLVVVTSCGVILSLTFNYMFLGILAICGGFAAPVLINTGSRNFTGLFIYMIILSLGAMGVARFRNWPILNILSFLFVWTIFIMAKPFDSAFDYPYGLSLLFSSIFFLIFTLQNSFFNTWLKKKSTLVEVGLEFFNCIIFTSVTLGNYPTQLYPEKLSALIPLGIAIILFMQLGLLIYKKVPDRAFKLTIMVLICSFLTLSIPLALEVKYVSFFWAILALSILYIGCRTSTKALAIISFVVYFIAGLTLLCNIGVGNFYNTILDRVLNFGCFTLTLVLGYKVLLAYPIFDFSDNNENNCFSNIIMQVFLFAALVFGFILCSFEASLFSQYNNESCYIARSLVLTIFIFLFALLKKHNFFMGLWTNLVVLFVTYGYVIYLLGKLDFSYCALAGFGKVIGVLPATIFLILASWMWRNSLKLADESDLEEDIILKNSVMKNNIVANILLTTALAVWFYYSSREIANIKIFIGNPIAVSILWIIYSITLLFVGIKKNIKVVRFSALFLFAISIVKIFFNDLGSTPIIYRIAGCIITGVILTLGALLYARNCEKLNGENNLNNEESGQ